MTRISRPARLALAAALLGGCGGPPSPGALPVPAAVDSIVLERTRCFGPCPAYRVSLTRRGEVRFGSGAPGDSTRAVDRVDPAAFAALLAEAGRIGFGALPPVIAGSPLCGPRATDHATAVVTVFGRGARPTRVEDDLGCHGERLRPLRAWEARIDSVAGTARWVRPAGAKG